LILRNWFSDTQNKYCKLLLSYMKDTLLSIKSNVKVSPNTIVSS
jgi:hypothetical protein